MNIAEIFCFIRTSFREEFSKAERIPLQNFNSETADALSAMRLFITEQNFPWGLTLAAINEFDITN